MTMQKGLVVNLIFRAESVCGYEENLDKEVLGLEISYLVAVSCVVQSVLVDVDRSKHIF